MAVLSSPWAAVDQRLLSRAAGVLALTGERVELKVGQDSLGLSKYSNDWDVVSVTKFDDCPCAGGVCYVGSCMSARVVEDLLKRLIAASGPKQLALF